MSVGTIDQWPHEVAEAKDDGKGKRHKFDPVVVTIAKVFPAKAPTADKDGIPVGWKFKEDPTADGQYKGVIWGAGNRYDGPEFRDGAQVWCVLAVKERNNGGYFYNVVAIKAQEGDAPEASNDAQPGKEDHAAATAFDVIGYTQDGFGISLKDALMGLSGYVRNKVLLSVEYSRSAELNSGDTAALNDATAVNEKMGTLYTGFFSEFRKNATPLPPEPPADAAADDAPGAQGEEEPEELPW